MSSKIPRVVDLRVISRGSVQEELFNELEKVLSPYLHSLITLAGWGEIISKINSVFQSLKAEHKIGLLKEICNNLGSDYILEYTISSDFGQRYFLYCHLRNAHLSLKFVASDN